MSVDRLLKRQLKKAFGKSVPDTEEFKLFLDLIQRAYSEFEQDKLLSERSLEISSKEHQKINHELQHTQADLLEMKELIEHQKLESIGQLAGGVAHDFNNILAGIRGSAQMIEKLTCLSHDSACRQYIDIILSSTTRGAELSAQLLGFAREGKYEKAQIDLQNIVNEAYNMVIHTIPKTIRLKRSVMDVYPVEGDSSQLLQVIMNLLVNARDAIGDKGEISISLSLICPDQEFLEKHSLSSLDSMVKVEVSDTGSGIPEAILDKIFDPFFTTKEVGEGTGLGLSMVHGIVHDHGGAIEIESKVDVGTTFSIYFPASSDTIKESTQASIGVPGVDIKGATILIVDDEVAIVNILQVFLEMSGMKVITAENGEEGVLRYEQNAKDIDLIIMDINMPILDGVNAYKRISEMKRVPTLFLSGHSANKEIVEVREREEVSFMMKPFDQDELIAELMALSKIGKKIQSE